MSAVSIIIPAYNPGPYLREAIASVLAQTFSDWELIVVDDGSTEDVNQWIPDDSRIHLVRQPNRGLSGARNAGIMRSKGDYIAFLDADDRWLPTKLEEQRRVMDADDQIAMCHTAFAIIDESGNVTGPGFAKDAGTYIDLLRTGCPVCVSTAMVRRECLAVSGLFDPLFTAVQDYDMWLKLARHYRIGFVPSVQAHYRVHGQNMSGNPALMADEVTTLLRRHHVLAVRRGDRKVANAAAVSVRQARLGWGCKAYDKCRVNLRRRAYRDFIADLSSAFRLAPAYTAKSLVRRLTMRTGPVRV